jgi:hypothetical protein
MKLTVEKLVQMIKESTDSIMTEQEPTIDEKWDTYLTRRNNVWRAAFIDRINGRLPYVLNVAKILKSGAVDVIESLYSPASRRTYTDELQELFKGDSIPKYRDLAAFINKLAETLYMEPLEGVLSLDKASPGKKNDVHKAMGRALEQSIQMIDPPPTASAEPESEFSPEVRRAMSLLKNFDAETFFGDYAGEGSRQYEKWKRWADGGFSGKNPAVLAYWPEPTTLVRVIKSMELGDKYTATLHNLVINSINKEIEDAGGFGPWLNAIRGPLEVDSYGSGLQYGNEGFASYLREKVFAAMKERGVSRSFLTKLSNKLGGGQFREGKSKMKFTQEQVLNIIKEEIAAVLSEDTEGPVESAIHVAADGKSEFYELADAAIDAGARDDEEVQEIVHSMLEAGVEGTDDRYLIAVDKDGERVEFDLDDMDNDVWDRDDARWQKALFTFVQD